MMSTLFLLCCTVLATIGCQVSHGYIQVSRGYIHTHVLY